MNEKAVEQVLGPLDGAAAAQPLVYILAVLLIALVMAVLFFFTRSQKEFLAHLNGRDERDDERLEKINEMGVACHAHSREMMQMAVEATTSAATAASQCAVTAREVRKNGNGHGSGI